MAVPNLATGPNPALNGLLFYTNGLGVPGKTPGVGNGLVNNHWANFGPRVGLAYDLTGNGKTIARAGFGVMFERIQGNDMYQAQNNLFGGNPNIQNVSLSDPHIGVDNTNSTISAASLPVTVNTQTWMDSTNYRNPASYQYSAGIQQQLGPTSVLSLAYVGNQGRYQSEINNANVIPQADWSTATSANYKSMLPFLGYNQILRIANDGNSHYNSFQAELHTNLKRGLQLSAAYTLAHGLDPTTNTGDGGDLDQVTNPYLGWQFDQGNSTLDRQQVGFVSFVYDLPVFRTTDNRALKAVAGGWQLSGIVTMETGLPVNMGINATIHRWHCPGRGLPAEHPGSGLVREDEHHIQQQRQQHGPVVRSVELLRFSNRRRRHRPRHFRQRSAQLPAGSGTPAVATWLCTRALPSQSRLAWSCALKPSTPSTTPS